jgi:hypothetical protein
MPPEQAPTRRIEDVILRNLGELVVVSAYLEHLVGDLFSATLTNTATGAAPDPGSLLVVTQNVSPATLTDWIRALLKARPTPPYVLDELKEILNDVDEARRERNALVHGLWGTDHSPAGTATVQTVRVGNSPPIRDQLVTPDDLHALIEQVLDVAERLRLFLAHNGLPHHRR